MDKLAKSIEIEGKNLKEIKEETIKVTKLINLYAQQKLELEALNHRQTRYNKIVESRRKRIKQIYLQKAKAIIEGTEEKKNRPNILQRIIDRYFIGITIGSLIIYYLLSRMAYIERGYKAIGGEGFFLIAPIILFIYRLADEAVNNTEE